MKSTPEDQRPIRPLPVQMPVVLRATDSLGRQFFERTEVVSIDERGARIRSRFFLNPGAEVTVQLPTEGQAKTMRVVWSGEPGSFYEGTFEVEFTDGAASWNLEGLRARWGARKF